MDFMLSHTERPKQRSFLLSGIAQIDGKEDKNTDADEENDAAHKQCNPIDVVKLR